ncbi:MAG: (d)CMP kinase [Pseudomonadota bacterium]
MQHIPVIAIDGPSGTGKGTLSHLLAQRLGWHELDSGALYRIVALAALRQHIAVDNVPALLALTDTLNPHFEGGEVYCLGEKVTRDIRTEACSQAASQIAKWPELRAALIGWQLRFRQSPGLVADGRDMGTVVFPDADLKFFIEATVQIRAERRLKQLQGMGMDANLGELMAELNERDARDRQRAVSPLIPAEDAMIVDTSNRSVSDVFELVWAVVSKHFGRV